MWYVFGRTPSWIHVTTVVAERVTPSTLSHSCGLSVHDQYHLHST